MIFIILILIFVIYFIFFHKTINAKTFKQFISMQDKKYINIEDSYRQRYFIKKLGFDKYLPKIFFVCKNESDLKRRLKSFRKPFMLKCNKGWRRQILVTHESKIDEVFNESKKWLFINHHNPLELGRKVKNLVYAEQLITCSNKPCKEVRAIIVKGKVKYIITPRGKISDKINREIYDVQHRKKLGNFFSISEIYFMIKNNKLHNLKTKFDTKYNNKNGVDDYNFEYIKEITNIGESISNYFLKPDVIVIDFYISLKKLYIGETGLYPCGGICFTYPFTALKL